jgi:hypothetical protein
VIVPVPVLAPKLAAFWVGLVTPIPKNLAVPLVLGIVEPVLADTTRARAVFADIEPMPYREAVRQNPEVICTLHRGMTRGLLEVLEPDRTLVKFLPHDPDTAGCRIELTSSHLEPEPG